MVGKVNEVYSEDGKTTKNVNVKLSVNFGAVYHVYVVKNFLRNEQETLEGDLFEQEDEQ